jgi:hypothetical protein
MKRRTFIPQRRRREIADRKAESDARRFERQRHLIGDVLTNVVWSNARGAAFCLACRAFAPAPTIDLALDLASETVTTCCQCDRPLDEPALASATEIGR